MSKQPSKHDIRAAKVLGRIYLPKEYAHRWPLFLDTLSCGWLALRLAWRDLVKASPAKKWIRR